MIRKRFLIYIILNIFLIMALISFAFFEGKETGDWILALFFALLLFKITMNIINELSFIKDNKKKIANDNNQRDYTNMSEQNSKSEFSSTTFSPKAAPSTVSSDALFEDAVRFVIDTERANTSSLQRQFGIGYNRASRMIDMMEDRGLIGPQNGSDPRIVYIQSIFDLEPLLENTEGIDNEINISPQLQYLTKIAEDCNIMENPSLILDMNSYIKNVESFSIDDFQLNFNLNFVKTNEFINSLKLLNILDEDLQKNEIVDDIETLIREATLSNSDTLSEYKLDNLEDGYAFEEFISAILNKLDFNAEVTPSSTDYGVDVLATKNQIVHAIQCKYYSNTVGNTAVQEIVSGMKHYNAHVGIVATNNYFTRQALELAKTNNIIMWDRDVLLEMIAKVN